MCHGPLAGAAGQFRAHVSKPAHLNKNSPDADGLLEYSVVYTDRALNHMSQKFQGTLKELAALLCHTYNAEKAVLLPGSGSSAMEAVARQFARGGKVMVIRNGFFSFRWTQIFQDGNFQRGEPIVHCARPVEDGPNPSYTPTPVEEVVASILAEKPDVLFAAHVETSAGIILPDDYIRAVADACKETGTLFVLDCIASGCLWTDMKALGTDVLISAPQKGWSAPAGCGVVMLGARALEKLEKTTSNSFVLDLKRWVGIMDAYHNPGPGHAYHCTMPTDTIRKYLLAAKETTALGLEEVREAQWAQGKNIRAMLESKGIKSVAAKGFQAPTVIVSYTGNPGMQFGGAFAAEGLQIAAGVPLMVDDFTSGPDYKTWRIGLFGLDKLGNIDRTASILEGAVSKII